MLLAAYAKGIGSCWICHLPRKKVLRKIFKVPRCYDVIAYVALGYYNELPKFLPRKYVFEEVASFNRFNFIEEQKSRTSIYRFLKRNAFGIYRIIPLKKYLLRITKRFEKFN